MLNKLLERLSKNPHYKMSKEQEIEYRKLTRKPMIQFGEPDINNNQFAKHDVSMVKMKYENKKTAKRILNK